MKKTIIYLIAVIYCVLNSSPVIAGEDDLYEFEWLDPGKKVFVLQNKYFAKANSIYIDAGYVSNNTNEFQDSNGVNLRFGYFFNEDIAIELSHSSYTNKNNNAHDSVKAVNGIIPFTRKIISTSMLYGIWSPFYGKVNTFNKIFYFDWYLGVGLGVGKFESNLDSVSDANLPNTFKNESNTMIGLKTGIKAHVSKQFHIGVEFVNQNYRAKTPAKLGKEVNKQSNDLVFSLGVSF